jgi:hypothetical protein
MIVPVCVARPMRRLWLFLGAARMRDVRLDVFLRRSLELGFAAGAAEQHVFAIVRQPMRRIRFNNHAANWVAQISADISVVSVVMVAVSVHGFFASLLARLISLAPEPAPSHNGKVNTENSGSIT